MRARIKTLTVTAALVMPAIPLWLGACAVGRFAAGRIPQISDEFAWANAASEVWAANKADTFQKGGRRGPPPFLEKLHGRPVSEDRFPAARVPASVRNVAETRVARRFAVPEGSMPCIQDVASLLMLR